jgi:hypothetical protein
MRKERPLKRMSVRGEDVSTIPKHLAKGGCYLGVYAH